MCQIHGDPKDGIEAPVNVLYSIKHSTAVCWKEEFSDVLMARFRTFFSPLTVNRFLKNKSVQRKALSLETHANASLGYSLVIHVPEQVYFGGVGNTSLYLEMGNGTVSY